MPDEVSSLKTSAIPSLVVCEAHHHSAHQVLSNIRDFSASEQDYSPELDGSSGVRC